MEASSKTISFPKPGEQLELLYIYSWEKPVVADRDELSSPSSSSSFFFKQHVLKVLFHKIYVYYAVISAWRLMAFQHV